MRPLIKKIQGALAIAFVGGCRLRPVPYDGGVDDASTKDASEDVHDATTDVDDAADDVTIDAPSDAGADVMDAALD